MTRMTVMIKEKQKTRIVNVSECIKLHEGKVQVKGSIFGLSEPYKVISSITLNCNCNREDSEERTKIFDPPIFALPKYQGVRCSECKEKHSIGYKNAITVHSKTTKSSTILKR